MASSGGTAAIGPVSNHGTRPPLGRDSVPHSSVDRGRYGRMFRELRPYLPRDETLIRLAHSMDPPMPVPGQPPPPPGSVPPGQNPEIPAG